MDLLKMPAIRFSFDLWRAGSLTELIGYTREGTIIANRDKIRKYAIGFCDGYKLSVRPKKNTVAVMFYTNEHWWTHLTIKEFQTCFQDIKNLNG